MLPGPVKLTKISIVMCMLLCPKASFTNYIDKILAFFDHLPPSVEIFYGMNVDKKQTYHLPTSSCKHSLRTTPNGPYLFKPTHHRWKYGLRAYCANIYCTCIQNMSILLATTVKAKPILSSLYLILVWYQYKNTVFTSWVGKNTNLKIVCGYIYSELTFKLKNENRFLIGFCWP